MCGQHFLTGASKSAKTIPCWQFIAWSPWVSVKPGGKTALDLKSNFLNFMKPKLFSSKIRSAGERKRSYLLLSYYSSHTVCTSSDLTSSSSQFYHTRETSQSQCKRCKSRSCKQHVIFSHYMTSHPPPLQ